MKDYKYEICCLSEEIALEDYGIPYEDLPEDVQLEIFDKASLSWGEQQACQLERYMDEKREGLCA